ncbi:amidohydrolase [Paracoccus albus]|uniref:amidohydrolase n=1 Tax=Paracoccus albus TaxID=3017784 RepID=UPI0022F12CAB|nr:amidohydrolase [Paracoccus albus]WBU58938.1 amidohydrolase [Paracoccus albus]
MSSYQNADLVLFNAEIWPGFGMAPAQAIALSGNRVQALGTTEDMLALAGPATRRVDLGGRFVMPGLNDAHLHLIQTGLRLAEVDVSPEAAPTRHAMLDALRHRAAQTPKGDWVLAQGFDQTRYPDHRMPTLAELDAALPDHPLALTRACLHIVLVNSRAFERAGITSETPDPDGGLIERADGRLTGLIAENAIGLIAAAQPRPGYDDLGKAITDAGRLLNAYGITSCMDAAVGLTAGMDEIHALQQAEADGSLLVRVWATLLGDPGRSIVEACHARGLVTGQGSDMLRIGGVKLFLDGSAGGRTAWMKEAYAGQPENFGLQMLSDDRLHRLVQRYTGMGYTMVCHAIGDAAIDQLVTAYEAVQPSDPSQRRRHRVEHCGYVSDAMNQRMRSAGILPAPQQAFIHNFGDAYIETLGPSRGLRSYPIGTWSLLGMKPSTGSDSPVCDPAPMPNIHAMITRQTVNGTVMDASERLSNEEALRAYTEYGAYSQGAEAEKGKLLPGMLADLAVFDRNLLSAGPNEILHRSRCEMTVLGGKIVHDFL